MTIIILLLNNNQIQIKYLFLGYSTANEKWRYGKKDEPSTITIMRS